MVFFQGTFSPFFGIFSFFWVLFLFLTFFLFLTLFLFLVSIFSFPPPPLFGILSFYFLFFFPLFLSEGCSRRGTEVLGPQDAANLPPPPGGSFLQSPKTKSGGILSPKSPQNCGGRQKSKEKYQIGGITHVKGRGVLPLNKETYKGGQRLCKILIC